MLLSSPLWRGIRTIRPLSGPMLGMASRSFSCKNTNNACGAHNNPCDSENVRRSKCEFRHNRKVEVPNLCIGACPACPKLGDACDEPKKQYEKKQPSMWYNPKCCVNPCPDMEPRYDQLHYRPQGLVRCYRRTWAECPLEKIAPRKVCCMDQVKLPPIVRRPRKPRTNKILTVGDKLALICSMRAHDKCNKMPSTCCRPVRNPPKCIINRVPSSCEKPRAPYPSYSECEKAKPKPLRKKECGCLKIDKLCFY